MAADWRLQQAVLALRSGAHAILTEDPDAELSLADDLPEEAEAVEKAMRQLIQKVQEADDIAFCARRRAEDALARAKRFEARSDRYRGLLLAGMDAMGWKKKEWTEGTLSVRQGQPNVLILDESMVPDDYKRAKITVDKESLRTALKSGVAVPGAVLTNNLPSVQIRSK